MCTDLSVDDGSHPESLGGPRNRKHSPEEYEDGEEEREQRSRHHVVQNDDEVAEHLRLGDHGVIEGKDELQESWYCVVELIRLVNVWDLEHTFGVWVHFHEWLFDTL